jgi:arylsulfatase A-like enzyme
MRSPPATLFALSAAALLFACAPAAADAPRRPNIVVMMTDDQRHDFMGCAGHPFLKTPNMDRLAKEGARFTNAFVTNALCAPSRATIMTGLYSHTHGVRDNLGSKLDPNAVWMPDLLRAAGYDVAFCGKSHVPGNFRSKTWDYYFGYTGQGNYLKPTAAESGPDGKIGPDRPYQGWMDDVVTEKAVAWMKKERQKPFALFLFFKAPHRRWDAAERHRQLYADAAVKKPALWDDPGQGKPQAFLQAANMIGQFPDTKNYDEMIRDYCRCLTGVDDNVGKVLAALEGMKALDDTAVMYTSDNGFFLGEWQRFDKRFMHEPSIRVPLLLRYPRLVRAGQTPAEMVINPDIAPTVLGLAGVPAPPAMHGRNVMPLVTPVPDGKPRAWRDAWLYEYFEYPDRSHNVQKNRGVRTAKWKYIHYFDPPFQWREEFELYDLEADPQEKENLAARPKFKTVLAEMRAKLDQLRKETGDSN